MKKCVLCQFSKATVIYKDKFWKIVKCNQCGLVRTERKTETQYEEYYRDSDYQKFEDLFRNIFSKRFLLIKKYFSKPGVMLDIGTSTGVMPEIFRKQGWETWGVEPSGAGNHAREKGIKVVRSTFEKARLSDNYFDLVVINHTLEHLEDPVSTLKKIKKILKSGGLVLVDVPNFGSLRSKLMGSNWPYLLPLEHNYQFTKESLEQIFKKVGFKKVLFESRSGVFDTAWPIKEIWESLITFKKRFLTNILSLPFDLLVTLTNHGDAMSLVGRK